MSTKNKRSSLWTSILYPDSMNPNYKIYLEENQIAFAISPLHNLDINATGELKKEHYHVILKFDSLKSFNQVNEICDNIKAVTPQICNSLKGMLRYFSHKDNPEKAQYDENDIYSWRIDVADIFEITASEKKAVIKEVCTFIIENDIKEYADLIEHALFNDERWFDVLQNNYTMFLTAFIRSRKFRFVDKTGYEKE